MRRTIIVIIFVIIILLCGGIIFMFKNKENNTFKDSINESNNNSSNEEELYENNNNLNNGAIKLKLSFNDEELFVILDDNETSKDFLNLLPMTLDIEDYNNTEKIGYLPRELNTVNAPSGFTPKIGDFAYYAPWGNICIFYKNFSYSNSLVKLGEFTTDIDKLANMEGSFKLTIEVLN